MNHTNFNHNILISCVPYLMYKIGQASKHVLSYHETWHVSYLMHEMRQASKLSANSFITSITGQNWRIFVTTDRWRNSSSRSQETSRSRKSDTSRDQSYKTFFRPWFTDFRTKLECLLDYAIKAYQGQTL